MRYALYQPENVLNLFSVYMVFKYFIRNANVTKGGFFLLYSSYAGFHMMWEKLEEKTETKEKKTIPR